MSEPLSLSGGALSSSVRPQVSVLRAPIPRGVRGLAGAPGAPRSDPHVFRPFLVEKPFGLWGRTQFPEEKKKKLAPSDGSAIIPCPRRQIRA